MSAGRIALITGATSGIGRASAVALARAGWRIVASGTDTAAGAALVEELGPDAVFDAADLATPGEAARLVERTARAHGRIDALVYSAGIHALGLLEDQQTTEVDRMWRINVASAIECSGAVIPVMRAGGGGVVVMISSEAGIVAVPQQTVYNMTKAALIMLTRGIAVDHAADGIRAISICPGTTRTPLVERAIASAADPRAHERMLAQTRPARRLGTPEEIAAAVEFVTRDDVAFMTGTELVLDGGHTAQ